MVRIMILRDLSRAYKKGFNHIAQDIYQGYLNIFDKKRRGEIKAEQDRKNAKKAELDKEFVDNVLNSNVIFGDTAVKILEYTTLKDFISSHNLAFKAHPEANEVADTFARMFEDDDAFKKLPKQFSSITNETLPELSPIADHLMENKSDGAKTLFKSVIVEYMYDYDDKNLQYILKSNNYLKQKYSQQYSASNKDKNYSEFSQKLTFVAANLFGIYAIVSAVVTFKKPALVINVLKALYLRHNSSVISALDLKIAQFTFIMLNLFLIGVASLVVSVVNKQAYESVSRMNCKNELLKFVHAKTFVDELPKLNKTMIEDLAKKYNKPGNFSESIIEDLELIKSNDPTKAKEVAEAKTRIDELSSKYALVKEFVRRWESDNKQPEKQL